MINPRREEFIGYDQIIGKKDSRRLSTQQISSINDKTISITGGAGSIGAEVARFLLQNTNSRIWLLDNDESRLHTATIKLDTFGIGRLSSLVTDIKDKSSIQSNLSKIQPDVIIHAAALKHVSVLEKQPREGYMTNVVGTVNIISYLQSDRNCRLCFISTDKAVNPTSILGKTKLIGELLVAGLTEDDSQKQNFRIHNVVRFGNVFMSRGSVVETFIHQLETGKPVTISNPKMKRFFMDLAEASGLICHSISNEKKGINVLEMGEPISIVEIASRVANQLKIGKFEMVEIGEKPGEKLSEDLFTDKEFPKVKNFGNGIMNIAFQRYIKIDSVPLDVVDDSDAVNTIEKLLNNENEI